MRRVPDQEIMSPVIEISSSNEQHYNSNKESPKKKFVSHKEFAESSPKDNSNKKLEADIDQIKQTVDVLKKIYMSNSPEFSRHPQSPPIAQTNMIVQKLFTPQSSKSTHGKVVYTVQTSGGYYIGQSLPERCYPDQLLGGQTPICPWWLGSLFKSAQQMHLTADEIAVAGYIFGRNEVDNLDRDETWIRTNNGVEIATRNTLKGLKPGQMIESEILSIVAVMLTEQEASRTKSTEYWFLPTVISIFIPINEDNLHWYLMVTDLVNRQIVMLDSFPSQAHASNRFKRVQEVAYFFEKMLKNQFFFNLENPRFIPVSDFPIVVPQGLPVQKDYSNDCGIFVASWMINHAIEGYMIEVDDGVRLRLALDIVMKGHNELHLEVKARAIEHMK